MAGLRGPRRLVWTLTLAYLGFVALMTLRPAVPGQPGWVGRILLWLSGWPPTGWLGLSWLEFIANVVLFVPFGLLFAVLLDRRRWWLVLVLAAATTSAIELAQLVIPNRFSDPRDLVANTGGAALGLLVVVLARRSGPVR